LKICWKWVQGNILNPPEEESKTCKSSDGT